MYTQKSLSMRYPYSTSPQVKVKAFKDIVFDLLNLSDESSSGEEDLDEEGIQRRRDLMRQRALTRAQIGVGQEEIMVRVSHT